MINDRLNAILGDDLKIVRLFKSIDDPRVPSMIDYPLEEILLIAFLAVLGNASTWTEIDFFGNTKRKYPQAYANIATTKLIQWGNAEKAGNKTL